MVGDENLNNAEVALLEVDGFNNGRTRVTAPTLLEFNRSGRINRAEAIAPLVTFQALCS